MADVGTLI